MTINLIENSHGKSHIRLLKVNRYSDRHDLKDLTISIAFEGDYQAAYCQGDNRKVLPTDTMKNTAYVLAKEHPLEEIEGFGVILADHFLRNDSHVSRIQIEISEDLWTGIDVAGKPHPHSFARAGSEKRTAVISGGRGGIEIHSGISGLQVLKTTQSGFEGFLENPYTTLQETSNRLLKTTIQADWIYNAPNLACTRIWKDVRQVLTEVFAEHNSYSVQHTLYAMGQAVLESFGEIKEIHLSLPNHHCTLFDLSPFGMENQNEVFVAVDLPFGLIEATMRRGVS